MSDDGIKPIATATRLNELLMDAPSIGDLLSAQVRLGEDEAHALKEQGYGLREDRALTVMALLNLLMPARPSGSGQLCAVINEMTGEVLQVVVADKRSLPSHRILAVRESHEALTALPEGITLPPDRYTPIGFIIDEEGHDGKIESNRPLQGQSGKLLCSGDDRRGASEGVLGGSQWCDVQVQGHACLPSDGSGPASSQEPDPLESQAEAGESRALW